MTSAPRRATSAWRAESDACEPKGRRMRAATAAPKKCLVMGDASRGSVRGAVIVNRRHVGRVVNVDVVVYDEIWIESDSQQAAFTARINIQSQEGSSQDCTVLNYAQFSGLLAHKESPIRSERHRGRRTQSCDDGFSEAGWKRRRFDRWGKDGERQRQHDEEPPCL